MRCRSLGMVPSSLRMLAFIVPFCECFHEAATVDAFGVAKCREMIITPWRRCITRPLFPQPNCRWYDFAPTFIKGRRTARDQNIRTACFSSFWRGVDTPQRPPPLAIWSHVLLGQKIPPSGYSGAAAARLGSVMDRGCRRRRHRDIGPGEVRYIYARFDNKHTGSFSASRL